MKKISKKIGNKKQIRVDAHQEIRNLGVLMEHMNGNIILVAEQHGDIQKTLGAHTKMLDIHTDMMGKISVDLTIIKEDIEFMKNSLRKKVDYDEFSALTHRVLLLEKRARS